MTNHNPFKIARAVFVLCAVTAIVASAQTFTTLTSFDGTDGSSPQYGTLAQGPDGNFYGTTTFGGAYNGDVYCPTGGCGTVFRITSDGTLITLYSFCASGNKCPDGAAPLAGLLLATDGNFYGTTFYGGANGGGGTVFRITPGGALTTVYSFCSRRHCTDGNYPNSRLVESVNGVLFGTTEYGGVNCLRQSGCGTIFRVAFTGSFTTLHSFSGPDGEGPSGSLILGTDGQYYGTTLNGGTSNQGTAFKITTTGKLTTLHNFVNGGDHGGYSPYAGLVQAANGRFYGTTFYGGTNAAYGAAFQMTTKGKLATLYSFDSADGANPYAGLVQATDGNLYGTTSAGGDSNRGTIFELTPGGVLTTLHSFEGLDGADPWSGLLQSTDGNFYGTTYAGGNPAGGTVFSLSTGLGPFVGFVLPATKIGATTGILGQGFTGSGEVSFNGTPATFTVVSDTYITATVPVGATTGYVTVTTPSGMLTSNVPFHVIP